MSTASAIDELILFHKPKKPEDILEIVMSSPAIKGLNNWSSLANVAEFYKRRIKQRMFSLTYKGLLPTDDPAAQEIILARLKIKRVKQQVIRNKEKQSRDNLRAKLIMQFGGKCQNCNYDKCQSCLHFHHKDPSKKEFDISKKIVQAAAALKLKNYEPVKQLIEELKGCELLCATCHCEHHHI